MKPKLGVHTQPAMRLEVQLICSCCGQPYYPNKAWEDQLRAKTFGAEAYSICPLCDQRVPNQVFENPSYRKRYRSEIVRLQALFEAEMKSSGNTQEPLKKPTYEELRARIAELQKQISNQQFKVSEKGAVSFYGLGRFPVTLYYEQWIRLLGHAKGLRDFLSANKSKLKLKSQAEGRQTE